MLTDADVTQRADTHLATPEFARASSLVLALVHVLLQPIVGGGERQGTHSNLTFFLWCVFFFVLFFWCQLLRQYSLKFAGLLVQKYKY
jgi:hypothetical protein